MYDEWEIVHGRIARQIDGWTLVALLDNSIIDTLVDKTGGYSERKTKSVNQLRTELFAINSLNVVDIVCMCVSMFPQLIFRSA